VTGRLLREAEVAVMKLELEQATRSLEEAEAALSLGNFVQLHELLQHTTELLDSALNHVNDSVALIEELHVLQESFEVPARAVEDTPFDEPALALPHPVQREENEEELVMVA
jgi:hypothetical protein